MHKSNFHFIWTSRWWTYTNTTFLASNKSFHQRGISAHSSNSSGHFSYPVNIMPSSEWLMLFNINLIYNKQQLIKYSSDLFSSSVVFLETSPKVEKETSFFAHNIPSIVWVGSIHCPKQTLSSQLAINVQLPMIDTKKASLLAYQSYVGS